jgi:hypothetical protein
MLVWCAILFGLGILAFLDSLFNYGEIFRRINSVLYLLVSLGLLVRTSMKIKLRYIETLNERVKELEAITGNRAPQSDAVERPKQPVL